MPKKKVKKIVEACEYGMIVELDLEPGQHVNYDGRWVIPMLPWEEAVYPETMDDYEFPPEAAR